MTISYEIPKRFFLLDMFRGIAIFRVVIFHWANFFSIPSTTGFKLDLQQLPLYEVLYVFYKPYHAAIPFFFCISGFIFFWLYSTRVNQKTITPKSFWVNRLSRLYPLHLVMLIVVAVGQFMYLHLTGAYFCVPLNDLYHFILNLFLASSWGIEKGWSFNAPVWLLSVQVLLYAIFFIFCRVFHRNVFAMLGMVILGFFITAHYSEFVGTGVKYFYYGGILFVAYERIIKAGDPWKVSVWLPYLTAVFWVLTLWLANPHVTYTPQLFPDIQNKLFSVWPVLVLLPSTVMSAALLETRKGPIGKRLSFVGDASFSIYLIHFPLQVIIAIVAVKLSIGPGFFLSAWVMISFFALLGLLSVASRRFFETPVQNYIRSRL